jgi:hypothetical protein
MRRSLLLSVVLFHLAAAFAQQHGNEWIDYGRRHFRFDIWADGVYRIDSATLAQSGFPIGTVDARHLMLFGKEQQVPVYVHGEADGVLNSGDYIEFWAEKADGEVDKRMYPYPDANPNPYYSLYNDTARYYLTWDAAADAKHMPAYANSDYDSHAAQPWGWHNAVQTYNLFYWSGLSIYELQQAGIGTSLSPMLEAEGFGGLPLFVDGAGNNVTPQDVAVATPSAYTGAGAPDAQVLATTSSQNNVGNGFYINHHTQWLYGPGLSIMGKDTVYNGSRTMRGSFTMPASLLGASTTIRYNVPHDLNNGSLNQIGATEPNYLDWQAVSNVRIRYARTFSVGGPGPVLFEVPAISDPLMRIDFSAFTGTPVVYAFGDSVRRVLPSLNAGNWRSLFPRMPGNADTKVRVFALENIQSVTALRPVGTNGYFTDFGSLDVDSAMLIVTHGSLMDGALAYANYREGSTRNPYSTLVADVDELYDQFGGGVPKHAYSIRAFCKYLLDNWSTQPRALFLIGKSINSWQSFFTSLPGIRPNVGTNYARCLVPSYGYPSSDQAFTTGLLFDSRRMDIPVGRLSANTSTEVFNYLAKVQATEQQPVAIWQKNVLHFAGGFSPGEINNHAQSLQWLGNIAADSLMGANVVPFKKQSSAVISQASADSVRSFIEDPDKGTSLLTFLAHAYSASFDITIDEPQNYQWAGKHPMVFGNSCYIGYLHGNGPPSASEKWVLTPNAGPIAFLAASEQGYTQYLLSYANPWYESLSRLNQGGSIGEHMKHAGLYSQQLQPTSLVAWNVQNFALQGDPTLTLNQHKLPDYTVAPSRILIEPATITADLDSFTVRVIVENQGRALQNSISVELTRTRSNGVATQYYKSLTNVYLRDTAVFRVPVLGFAGGQGPNQLSVRVDLEPDLVPELEDVANNQTNTSVFISSGDLVPVWPYEYAIVPDPQMTLKASTGDPFAPLRTYVFQIDTTDLYNSPIMQSASLQAPGGVVSWDPSAIFSINSIQDSTVFYWRCSLDSSATGTGQYNWYERSFQYIPEKWGWGQAHYFQFKNDTYAGINYDRPERDFDFEEGVRTLRANVLGNQPSPATGWGIELAQVDYGGCGAAAYHVAVVDPATMEPWNTYWVNGATGQVYNPQNQFGNYNNNGGCRNRPEGYFGFHTSDGVQLAGLQNMLTSAIPDGHHVLIYTWRHLDKFGTNSNAPGLAGVLELAGLPSFDALQDSVPYICYFRKGDPSTFRDTIATSLTEELVYSIAVQTAFAQGNITTMNAGPAASWHGLYWDEVPASPTDSTRIKVIGFPPGSSIGVPLLDLESPLDSLPDFGAVIDAQQYPILRLRGTFHDSNASDAVPAQLERWQLLFDPVPECAIHPPLGLYNDLEGYAEGQLAGAAVAVQNISAFGMDSLLIEGWVIDAANNRRLVHSRVNPPLPAGAWVVDTMRFSTLDLGGWNTLLVEANPLTSSTGRAHQAEQYHFNNIAYWRFEVEQDVENPILDITFDGRHILNGDIVSARPEIRITLDDENMIRLLESPADTANFKVFLTKPDGSQEQVRFRDGAGNEVMRFTPANGPDNIARIDYRPIFNLDGKHNITVFANDLSGNRSGDNDYQVNFEVINRPTITEVLNYPNPFTTSTRFVFTVTGQQPPTQLRIQIMTVTGKVVREVSMAEIGPLYVGRNITEFAWDGTDQFGDRLARGVYLYRVMARLNGEDIEVRETQASQYFTKGFGKMYLLR